MEYICSDCPRKCSVLRTENKGKGFCRCGSTPTVVRAAPHFGEEPCISGNRGSGAVFFSGCNLRCIFCQNHEISRTPAGIPLETDELVSVFLELQETGVHNINLITGSHFTRSLLPVLEKAKAQLSIPVIWNSSGYESVETLRMLDGLIDIYLPDYKYADSSLAARFSSAPDYPDVAFRAIEEMVRQRGAYQLSEDGMLLSGVMIRHLILPSHTENTMDVIDRIADSLPAATVLFSLMSQYTPMAEQCRYSELLRPLTAEENDSMIHYMKTRHINEGYWQELSAVGSEMIPDFHSFDRSPILSKFLKGS